MMNPVRPNVPPPNPQRDALAGQVQNASWLPDWLLRGGSKSPDDIRALARGMRGEGASPTEIYNETGKYVDPKNETGLVYGPGADWQFQIPDKDMRLTSRALSYLKPGDSTETENLPRLIQHDLLYDYNPDMQKVRTQLNQLGEGDTHAAGGLYQEPTGLQGDPMGLIKGYGAIGVDPNDLTSERSVRNIVAHEINHPMQWQFDMPRGGEENTPGLDKFYNSKMVPQATQMRKALQDQYNTWKKGFPADANSFETWQKAFPEKAALLDEASRVGGYANAQTVAQHKKLMPFDQYLSLAGEQRAMQGARDSNKTAEELRASPPMQFQPFSNDWRGKSSMLEPLQIVRRGKDYSLPELPYFSKDY